METIKCSICGLDKPSAYICRSHHSSGDYDIRTSCKLSNSNEVIKQNSSVHAYDYAKKNFNQLKKRDKRRKHENNVYRISFPNGLGKIVGEILYAPLSDHSVANLIDDTIAKSNDPIRFDVFNTDHINFCGQLDVYFNQIGGNWSFTDWRCKNDVSEVCTFSLPFEAAFDNRMPTNPREVIYSIMKLASKLHKDNIIAGNWKPIKGELPMRINPEKFEKIRNYYATKQ